MAPTRKSRSVNKRYANEISPVKDVISSSKSKLKKKLSDKLGPQWSKGELQRFYEAYRTYGRDWKKVAAQVRNRSAEMVEALYNMNRAYLSLPEGTASVVGLVAMMTDHYNVLEGSDNERESNDASGIPRKSQKQKRKWAKVQLNASEEDISQSWSVAASGGCLSLLKRARPDGSQPRAVKRRTPRVPVSYSHKKDDRDDYIPLNKKDRRSDVDTNDDEVAHVAALALTEASQRGGSPQVFQSPYKRTEHGKSSPIQSLDKMSLQGETAHPNVCDTHNEEGGAEVRILNKRPENGAYTRETKSLMDMEGVGTVEVHRKGKKFYRKKMKVEEVRNSLSDDEGEACSGTEEGLRSHKGKVDSAISTAKSEQLLPRVQRRKSKKLFFGDETTALNALQTLADLSLMLPDSTMESEASVQLKEEEQTALDMDDKFSAPEASSHPKDKVKVLGPKEKALGTINEVEVIIPRKSKLGRYSGNDVETVAEVKEQPEPPSNMWKRKHKSVLSKKISNAEALANTHTTRTLENKALAEEENKFSSKGKRTSQISAESKQWKPGRVLEGSSVNDQKRVAPTAQVPVASPATLPTKHQSRRKMDLKRKLSSKEVKSSENSLKTQPNNNKHVISQQNRLLSVAVKEKLSCCLSSDMVRRWCTFEWFYSAIDYPWFSNREFVEYLNHVGLGHIPRLTRVEWGVIRSSLGKPRRLSKRFLHDEREKLKKYRDSVRKHYAELRTGVREGLPRDLPRPLTVGQRVIAIHPKTRELHDGSVLTVDNDKCRVQFDRPELGVEFVMDIDCMPSNPLDNMPESLRRQISADKLSAVSKELQVNGHHNFGSPMLFASDGHLEKAPIPSNNLPKEAKGDMNYILPQAKSVATEIVGAQQATYGQPCTLSQIQAREATIRALSEVNRALSKKEALLMELKNTNNDILENQNGGVSLKDSEPLKKHIAMVLVQLKEANDQASSALLQVRQRNTYPESSRHSWLKPPANSKMLDNSSISHESGSAVVDIVNGSRLKAHTMVDAAIKAMSSVKEGEDAFIKIGQAVDHVDKLQLKSDPRVSGIRSPELVNGSLDHHNQQFVSGTSDPQLSGYASGTKLQDGSDKNEAQIPSELITSCVATLLMIQTCTERHTPADVAQIIDSAVSSLHPRCPQNLPIYREIEMCMGRIKTQILALIPTSI